MIFRIGKFQQQPEFWKEIDSVTAALRSEVEPNDPEKQFLCEMFKHLSPGKFENKCLHLQGMNFEFD